MFNFLIYTDSYLVLMFDVYSLGVYFCGVKRVFPCFYFYFPIAKLGIIFIEKRGKGNFFVCFLRGFYVSGFSFFFWRLRRCDAERFSRGGALFLYFLGTVFFAGGALKKGAGGDGVLKVQFLVFGF
jgi:hypothetical protein